jgi:ABC-type uncharacterized transport system substrate-binding protein
MRVGLLIHGGDPLDNAFIEQTRGAVVWTAQPALRHRLPSISLVNQVPESDGLMSYGASRADVLRRTAACIDRVFKGAAPAEVPVEGPTKCDPVVKPKTPNALGLTIPCRCSSGPIR